MTTAQMNDPRDAGKTKAFALPPDTARCSGYEMDDGTWRPGCEDCRRRTDRSDFPLQVWMGAPGLFDGKCPKRIEPK